MAIKKDKLMGGINTLLGEMKPVEVEAPDMTRDTAKRKSAGGRPRSNFRQITKSSQEGCKEQETRATFIVDEILLEEFKAIAWKKRLKVKDAANLMLREFVEAHKDEAE